MSTWEYKQSFNRLTYRSQERNCNHSSLIITGWSKVVMVFILLF